MIHPVVRRRDGLVVAGCLALLLLLARLIDPRQPPRFDEAVLDWLHLPTGLGQLLLQIYKLTGVQVTGVLVVASLWYLVLRRWWRDLRLLVMATGGILVLVDMVLKPLFDRARPHDGLLQLEGRSFPSGHAAGSVAFYGAMVLILASHHPQLRRPLSVAASLWIALVWLSTLQARAHWPTDLLAGGAVGLAWLTLCLSLWRQPAAAASVAAQAPPDREREGER
jgi:membrane-associated phospholipid phosphatase